MGKAIGTHLFSGRLYQFIYKVREGKQYVSAAPERKKEHRRRMAQINSCYNYRQNLKEFGGASKVASEIFTDIRLGIGAKHGPILKPYAFNNLSAALKNGGDHRPDSHQRGRPYFSEFTILDGAKALRGFDFSHPDAPTTAVKMRALGPQHNPDAIHVSGLEAAATAIRTHGNADIEFRFRIVQTRFQERVYDETFQMWQTWESCNGMKDPHPFQRFHFSKPSGWIPTEIIPQEGITIPLPERPEGEKYLTTIVIEWREHRTVGRRLIYHRKKAIVRIVSAHAPAEAMTRTQDSNPNTKTPHPAHNPYNIAPIPPIVIRDPKRWQRDPKADLKEALGRLQT
jgi:hypothetical protein